jgi:hypothetical protein
MMSVASQKRRHFSVLSFDRAGKSLLEQGQDSVGDAAVLLFAKKKSMTKTDRCAGALS